MKILVVDDSRMDRKRLIHVLKKSYDNLEIVEATDGEEGFKLLSENYYFD